MVALERQVLGTVHVRRILRRRAVTQIGERVRKGARGRVHRDVVVMRAVVGEVIGNRATADENDPDVRAALFAGSRDELVALSRRLAARDGPIIPLHLAPYRFEALLDEVSVSVNTAAAGGNASLMTMS